MQSLTLNLKAAAGREILYKLVQQADVFGQNFRPGAAEKNGFGYDTLKKINPKIVYVSISGYGPHGPHALLPGTDAMAQALGGIAKAFATPGQPFKTGVVSVADETCAILAFGGIMAGLYCAKTTGVGQKIDTSLLGGQIRLMGWTLTTAMWKDENPVTGQARIMGTAERPAISACFNDQHGKPFVFQMGGADWSRQCAPSASLQEQDKGWHNLGVAVTSAAQREAMLKTLDALFATASRDKWVEILRQADIVSAPINTVLEASHDPDVLANAYITEMEYPKYGKKVKVHGSPWHFSETPAKIGIAPELGEHNVPILRRLGYSEAQIQDLKEQHVI